MGRYVVFQKFQADEDQRSEKTAWQHFIHTAIGTTDIVAYTERDVLAQQEKKTNATFK